MTLIWGRWFNIQPVGETEVISISLYCFLKFIFSHSKCNTEMKQNKMNQYCPWYLVCLNLQGTNAWVPNHCLVQPKPCKLILGAPADVGCFPAAQPNLLSDLCFQPHTPAAQLHPFCSLSVLALPLKLSSSPTHRAQSLPGAVRCTVFKTICNMFSNQHYVGSSSPEPLFFHN